MIKPLTSLRFFFALFVFLSHANFIKTNNAFYNWSQRNIFFEGYLGVSFFFILSGFVLALSYKNKIEKSQISKKNFWIGRFARIYPLHLLTLIAILILYFFNNEKIEILKLIINLFLIQSFIPIQDYFSTFNSPSWSISDEAFFYLLFPFIISLFSKYKWAKYIFCILLIVLITSIFLTDKEYHKPIFYINPFLRIFDFVLGILLYQAFCQNKFKKLFSTTTSATIIEIFSLLLFMLFFIFHNMIPRGFRFSVYYWIPMCLIIYAFAHQRGIFSKILSVPKLVLLGEISFGFYMFHMVIIEYGLWIKQKVDFNIPNQYLTILIFVVTLAISYLSFICFEKPVNKWIKNKFQFR